MSSELTRSCKSKKKNTLVISAKDMNDKIRIIKSRKNSIVLIYGVSETVKH